MASETSSAVIGAVAGAVCGGAVSYVVGRFQAPEKLRTAMVEKKMHDRWDDARKLRYELGETAHAQDHILDGDMHYIERGMSHRQTAREQARDATPLLGEDVRNAVIELTDTYEEFFRRAELKESYEDLLDPIGRQTKEASDAIDEALKSLPPA